MSESHSFLHLVQPSNIAWPKTGDRLIKETKASSTPIGFSNDPISRQVFIWDGYTKAGRALIEQCERNPLDQHDLIYPILFCYRHSLELAMKWVVDQYGRYAVPPAVANKSHDLLQNWNICKDVIVSVGSDGDGPTLKAVEHVIKEFHNIDRTSTAFRYAHCIKGKFNNFPKTGIDLLNIRNVMEAIDNFFTGVDGQLDANKKALS